MFVRRRFLIRTPPPQYRVNHPPRAIWVAASSVALLWWLVALLVLQTRLLFVWFDQRDKFLLADAYFWQPYVGMSGFFSPPWAVAPLLPFAVLPLPLATLLQALIYCGLLSVIGYRYGMTPLGWAAALLSPLALDAIIELNIDWIALIGLLVPAQYSLIFLVVKPQACPGYLLTLTPQQLRRAVIGLLLMLLASFFLWGASWPLDLLREFSTRPLALTSNLSPWGWLSPPLAVIAGVALLVYGRWRRDLALQILTGVFFTPYLPTYTAIIPYLFVCIRWPHIGAYLTFGLWLITLAVMLPVFAG